MSQNSHRSTYAPRARDIIAGAVVFVVLGGVLMSRGGRPTPTFADTAPKLPPVSQSQLENDASNQVRELISDDRHDSDLQHDRPQRP